MRNSRQRFTTHEKSVILNAVHLNGLEPTLRKYHLTLEVLVRWQKKFKGSNVANAIPIIKEARRKPKAVKTKLEQPEISEKEDALLRLVASLIVQCVLDEDAPNR
ncbi:hypothetical protein GCM10011511_26340 [Puia dinghuensis]|uniref:Transposase n=1 Tax=Puia dinghuensis TaxID=1792502 RepID=A0A8J2UDQ4_9BACT|nr:hypothetical protein GCM10011511_26340 [Puia dinghuensis]